MPNRDLACCCLTRNEILRKIEFGDDKMKSFKYKENIYVLNQDVKIEELLKYYNDKDEKIDFPREEGTYHLKKKYAVTKGYEEIEIFDTKEEADTFVNNMLKEVGEEYVQ